MSATWTLTVGRVSGPSLLGIESIDSGTGTEIEGDILGASVLVLAIAVGA